MKKILLIFNLLAGVVSPVIAEHIKGGEMYYFYLGDGATANTSRYQIILKLYIDCRANNPGQLDNSIPLTFFDKSANNAQYGGPVNAPLFSEEFIQFDPASNPCIGNPPTDVCYRVRKFSATVTLPNTTGGYTVAYQRCCRIDNIINLQSPSNSSGATYICEIPGTAVYPDAFKNNSPIFVTNDAAAVCVSSSFTFSFAADQVDAEDSISYQLCGGFRGASQANPNPDFASAPPYGELGYSNPFSGTSPLGAASSINPKTGLITGIAPGITGQYVISACAYEYRNGVLINIHRKDIHVAVSNCIPLKAALKPDYSFCDDLLVTFKNESFNPAGSISIWQFGDNSKPDTTMDPEGRITHQYADSGVYTVKLKVILAGQCVDSTTTKAKVFPGFFPGFTVQGTCVLLPLQFTDTTYSRYGSAGKWHWTFGDETTLADTSRLKNPSWKYATIGFKSVQLIVESTKGCIDTITKMVEVRDKPPITLPFKDTLICSIDTLQLRAVGNGLFSWGPNYNILNTTTSNPLVFPKQTTWYKITLNENGCINDDSIRVRVVDFVSLFAGSDTTICATDTILLKPQSDGLQYLWTPSTYLSNPTIKNPFTHPSNTITYTVRATIGKCNRDDDITIRTVPYPVSNAGPDTTICFQDTATLRGSIGGTRYTWSPINSLSSGNTLTPLAFPLKTTTYSLNVFDTLGCPKPGVSYVKVTVRDNILAFAGNDTSVVVGQPLQLLARGADLFQWSPPSFLSNPNIQNPVAFLNDNFRYILRAYTPEGCFALDTINIRVFKTNPDIFVPNAFAPNGKNRVLRPIPVGITRIDYFRIFNRYGQLVFQSSDSSKGWDGTLGGKNQDSGTYVWMVKGTDFTGKTVMRRGTAVLIR